jgi:hypothetical protein
VQEKPLVAFGEDVTHCITRSPILTLSAAHRFGLSGVAVFSAIISRSIFPFPMSCTYHKNQLLTECDTRILGSWKRGNKESLPISDLSTVEAEIRCFGPP